MSAVTSASPSFSNPERDGSSVLGTEEIAASHGMTPDEFLRACELLGRTPNVTELGIISVMWSEHCSYKSSRVWLRGLPTTGARVIQGPGENAGVIDIGDGDAIVFKMESHNHPSFIEPYQGAATGVGGIMRDVFTMGARPIAMMNALRFGAPDHPKTRHLVAGVVAGIGDYGNCVGIPTVGGETNFDAGYNGNILVNAMCVGLARTDKIFYSAASGAGNPVVYVGSKTGRDGIHGATMASAEFDDATEEKRPTVQVGDPFAEKLLLEACLELMEGDAILAIQDMGAAGLTSSSVEMAAKGGSGIDLDLDRVPQREDGMTASDMMLSESQERMLMVLRPGSEAEAERIFQKWGLDFATIGRTTGTGRIVVRHRGEVAADLPTSMLAQESPKYRRPFTRPAQPAPIDSASIPPPENWTEAILKLISCPDMASKRWMWEQYDRHVMADTIADSERGYDAAIVRIHGTQKAIAITMDCTPRYVAADPYEGGKQAVAEAWRNLCAVGADPIAITDNLNFGNPERPEIMGQFVAAVEGIAEACRALDFPVVSGNVSLYNETNGRGIPPTPAIGGVGLLADYRLRAGYSRLRAGDTIVLIGPLTGELGRSLYMRELLGREEGPAPAVDLGVERRNGEFVRGLIRSGIVQACHDLSDGGLIGSIAEMAIASNVGATVAFQGDMADVPFFFGEGQSRYLIGLPENAIDGLDRQAQTAGVEYLMLGTAGGTALSITGADGPFCTIEIEHLREAHERWLPAYMSNTF